MHLFLLGILADETFRFLWRRFFQRHPERLAQLAALRARARSHLAGAIDASDLIGSEQIDPIDTSDMHYMDREGPGEIDGGTPPDNYGPSSVPFFDVAGGAGLLDAVKAKALERAQNEAAAAIVDNFASEMMSGCLGAVDEDVRAALARHLAWHRRREAAVAGCVGWGIPGLSTLAKVKTFADKLSPSAYLKRKLMARARGGGGGGGRAPGPQPDGAPPEEAAAPEGGDDAPADATEGALMTTNLQSPTNQLVHTLQGKAAAELVRRAERGDPAARHAIRQMRHVRGDGWRGRPPAVTGWGLPWHRAAHAASSAAKNPAGKLLISAVPGGASALAAREIANKALKSGDLKPEHLQAAGDLTKRGRAGDKGALMKIAQIKRKAGRGDRHAEVALDRIKLAHCIQSGKACGPSARGGGTLRRHYAAGADTMVPRGRPAKL